MNVKSSKTEQTKSIYRGDSYDQFKKTWYIKTIK